MRLFKTTDEKLAEIGFVKVTENNYGACYQRENNEYNYTQRLDISHKQSGKHLIQSYEEGVNKDKLNNAVGLTCYEAKLAIKKYHELKRKYNWR